MQRIEPGDRQLTNLRIALRRYEQALKQNEDEELGDTLDDLLMVQDLIAKLSAHQPTTNKA